MSKQSPIEVGPGPAMAHDSLPIRILSDYGFFIAVIAIVIGFIVIVLVATVCKIEKKEKAKICVAIVFLSGLMAFASYIMYDPPSEAGPMSTVMIDDD